MNLVMIQTIACGAYGWFQQALIRLCVCAAVALFVVLVLRTQAVRDAAARIAALGTLISVLPGVVMFGIGLATTLSAEVARSIVQSDKREKLSDFPEPQTTDHLSFPYFRIHSSTLPNIGWQLE